MRLMCLRPVTDTARKSMVETVTHALISLAVIVSATVLAAMHSIDTTAWAAAIASGIGVSGGVSVLQGRASNGKVVSEARELVQMPGGRRHTDPPAPEASANYTGSVRQSDPPPKGASLYDDPTEELDLP